MSDEGFEDTVEQSAALGATMPLADQTQPSGPPAEAQVQRRGDVLGRYVILDKLGEGAMGAVYSAYDPELDRRVALKVLHPETQSTAAKTQGRGRLVREAKAMARLNHPNVIQVFDVGTLEESGDVYVAMEFIDGSTVTDWLVAQERSWEEILDVYLQAAEGLAHAHSQGVVHRDFKPDNCLIDKEGRVRVIDFGIAQRSETVDQDELQRATEGATAQIAELARTHAGMIIGTPAYMSFEQLEGRAADERSDQFALAVAIYEALYRQTPFEGSGLLERMVEVMEGRVRPAPEHSPAPDYLEPVLRTALATDPEARHASIEAMIRALRPPVAEPRSNRAFALGLGAIVAVAVAGILAYRLSSPTGPPPVCVGLGADVAAVWNDEARERLRGALMSSEAGHAEATVSRVLSALDARGAEWVELRRDACEDTRVRGEVSEATLDLRMACLDTRLTEMRTAIDVLSETGGEAVDHAVQVVGELPRLDRCADLSRLEAEAAHRPPPDVAERVEALRAEAMRIKALGRAGALEAETAAAEQLVVDAREVGWDPMIAEALLRRALAHVHDGTFRPARELLIEAAWRADRGGDQHLEAEVWVYMVFVIGSKLREREEALRWVDLARAAVEQGGDDPLLAGRLDYNEGLTRLALGRYEVALTSLRRAETRMREVYEDGDWHLASVLGAQASALSHLGRSEESISTYRRALGVLREGLGPEHPSNGALLNNLATALRRAGRLEESRTTLQQALELKRRTLGPNHPSIALTLYNLGEATARLGDLDRAEALFDEARELRARTLGESHPLYTDAQMGAGYVALMRQDYDRAITVYRQGLAQHEAQGAGYAIAQAKSTLANALYRSGRAREAEPLLREALAYYEGEGIEARPSAYPQTRLGAVLVELGRPEDAIELLTNALETRSEGDVDPEDLGFSRYALGRALFESGRDRHRGWELVQASQRDFTRAGIAGAWATPRVTSWLEAHPRPQEQG